MLDPAQLAALAAIHRRGSFDQAAADLHVTPSAVSQRLKLLEERSGVMLIRRGHPSTATEAGLRLIRHFDQVELLESALHADLPQLAAGHRVLRIAVNADSLATWIVPALAAVEGALFNLIVDDQDISQEWLRQGAVAAAITGHPGPLQGCDTLALGALRYRATASPDFLRRWMPAGATADVLARAPALVFSHHDRLQDQWAARHVAGHGAAGPLPAHRMPSTHAFVDGCLAGLGWGMNPEPLVREHLESGRLRELIPDTGLDTPLFWQFARLTAVALAPLTAAIRQAAARVLVPA